MFCTLSFHCGHAVELLVIAFSPSSAELRKSFGRWVEHSSVCILIRALRMLDFFFLLLCGRAMLSTHWKCEEFSPITSIVSCTAFDVTAWPEHQLISLFGRVSEKQFTVLNLLLDFSASLILLLWIGLFVLRFAQEVKLVPRGKQGVKLRTTDELQHCSFCYVCVRRTRE